MQFLFISAQCEHGSHTGKGAYKVPTAERIHVTGSQDETSTAAGRPPSRLSQRCDQSRAPRTKCADGIGGGAARRVANVLRRTQVPIYAKFMRPEFEDIR
jgi:hypothetical protein